MTVTLNVKIAQQTKADFQQFIALAGLIQEYWMEAFVAYEVEAYEQYRASNSSFKNVKQAYKVLNATFEGREDLASLSFRCSNALNDRLKALCADLNIKRDWLIEFALNEAVLRGNDGLAKQARVSHKGRMPLFYLFDFLVELKGYSDIKKQRFEQALHINEHLLPKG